MTAVERLVRELRGMDRRLRAVETQPQLPYSSIEDGGVDFYVDDTYRGTVGLLPDGGSGVMPANSPAPPAPSAPTWQAIPRGFAVSWDGRNADGTDVQPLDWSRLEVHVSLDAVFVPSPATLYGTIETPQGGTVVVSTPGNPGPWTVRLVARNTSGTASGPSVHATATAGTVVLDIGQVTADHLAPNAVTVGKVADGAISAAKIAALAIEADKIAANAVTAVKIAAGAVTAVAISANAIEANKIAANAITSDKIAANAVTAGKIAANAILAGHILAGEIVTDKLAANAVTADKILAEAVTSDKITAGTITGKTLIGGMFATRAAGENRVVLEAALYDVLRFYVGSTGAVGAELRGYMNDVGAYGFFVNGHAQLGNTNAVLYQVGRRSALGSNVPSASKIRAGTFSVTFTSGIATVTFPIAMGTAPTIVYVQFTSRAMASRVYNVTATGFDIEAAVGGSAPGNGTYSGYYYAEHFA